MKDIQGTDFVIRLKGIGDYYVFTRGIFSGTQTRHTIDLIPRGSNKVRPFKREDVIIDSLPLEDEVKPGARVLVKIGRNKSGQDVYWPAIVLKKAPSTYVHEYIVKPVCEKAPPLGVSDGFLYTRFSNDAFTASSYYDHRYEPNQARVSAKIPWCAGKNDNTSWLQVDLQADSYICSLTTSPFLFETGIEAVTNFTLAVSKNNRQWHHLMENNKRKVFKREFPHKIVNHFVNLVNQTYRYIRFYVVGYKNWPCLGVEVHGYGKIIKSHPPKVQVSDMLMEGSVCKLQLNKCKKPAVCKENDFKIGNYTCSCGMGFRLVDNVKCKDINECQRGPCGALATCINTPGSYKCNCKKGFQNPNGSLTTCDDIDECSALASPCSPHARCNNTEGSFTCDCKHGFQGNGYTCVDIDECKLDDGNSKCKNKNSVCTNSPGSYKCTCKTGFTGDGNTCTDTNECEDDPDPCKYMNGKCFNNAGSYTCDCLNGYNFEAGRCQEIDECANPEWNDCNQHAKCTNKPGTYSCDCKKGFTGSGYDTFGCLDIDECSEKNKCGAHSKCENSVGSFTCTCDNGYTSHNGRNCFDIDECKTGKPVCHRHAICKNLPGSYACLCSEGFTGRGDVADGCTALPWCKWKGHVKCDKEFRHCDSMLRRCTGCKTGYEDKNGVCQDANECEKNPCDKSAACVNTIGSFKCHCKKGYLLNSKTYKCEDIDECGSAKRHCHFDAVCENTPGSYRCKCKKGFDGDGFSCADTNECYLGDYKCPKHSVCSNTLGSYRCTCKMGYHRSEDKCKKDVTSKTTSPTKDFKVTSLLDFDFLWNRNSAWTLRSQALWKLISISATLILAKIFM